VWSADFKRFYIKRGTLTSVPPVESVPHPARDAPKSEWDRFDAWSNDYDHGAELAWALDHYPVHVTETQIAGVSAAVITPRAGVSVENKHRVLINLRGGGFCYNRGLTFGQLESIPVSALGRIKVITLDYRQAPFHRFPAASEDVEAVYTHLLAQHSPAAIGIFGCSAGGVLAAQCVARFAAKSIPRPGAVGLLTAAPPPPCMFGQRGWGDSAMWFTGVPKAASDDDRAHFAPAGWYMEEADVSDVQAYPGSSEAVLASFPPTLLLTGTRDLTLSSVVAAHARFLKLDVDASLYVMEGGLHGAHVLAVDTPEGRDAQAYVARWFKSKLAS
jgi:acetyl esterase/lipase